ncbi:kinase-like protein, partial [Clavulina sp. PMI_390]
REALIHQLLQHPNILPFLGIYYENPASYPLTIVPFIERGSLENLLTSLAPGELMKMPDFIKLVTGSSRGVAYLHAQHPPIIHGDLHSGNILIDQGGNPLLCDFGRSRICHDVSRSLSTREEGGRLRFLAPEVYSGQRAYFYSTQESDIFGLAMTYLHAWSCQLPFIKFNEHQVTAILCQGQRPVQPLNTTILHPAVKAKFWTLLTNMWAHQVSKRPSSKQVLEHLD